MRGLVFAFDALVGLLSLVYILLFALASPGGPEAFLLDLSVRERVSDFLLTTHLAPDYSPQAYLDLLGADACFPPDVSCDASRDWSCASWRESRVEAGRVVFEPRVVCVEALS